MISSLMPLCPLLTCFAAVLVIGYLLAQRRRTGPNRAYLTFAIATLICSVLELLVRLPLSPRLFEIASSLSGPALYPLSFFYLNFVYEFTGKRRDNPYFIFLGIAAVSVIISIFVTPMAREFDPATGVVNIYSTKTGALLFLVATCLTGVYGTGVCIRYILQGRNSLYKKQLKIFVLGIFASLTVGVATMVILPIVLHVPASASSISLLIVNLTTYYIIRKYNFLSVDIVQVEQTFEKLFNNVQDAVLLLNTSGAVIRANQSAGDLLGFNVNRMNAEDLGEYIQQYKWDADFSGQTTLVSGPQSSREVLVSQARVSDTNSSLGTLLILRDITEYKKAEEELLHARNSRSIAQLAGGIAHDFNNLLSGIVTSFGLARMDVDPESETSQVLELGEKAALNARGLTQQLLTFAKGTSTRKEVFDVNEVIREICSFSIRGTAIQLRIHLPEHSIPIDGDPTQAGQIFQNLILNASQVMPEGGAIAISAQTGSYEQGVFAVVPDGDMLEVRVTDQGPGIPKDVLSRIFEPYFTTKENGSGLGLAVAHSIARKHNGDLKVLSTTSGGTTFGVYLPIYNGTLPREIPQAITMTPASGRILVMDDDAIVRKLCSRLLTRIGYSVCAAKSGEEALELFDTSLETGESYAAVISDLTVPGGMGGIELARKLHERDPDIKIIVSSGYSEGMDTYHHHRHGFHGILPKPYGLSELKKVLRTVLT